MSITETIPSLGTVPTTDDPDNFDSNADALLGTALPAFRDALNIFSGQANTLGTQATTDAATASSSASVAAGAANFAGAWSGLTGALDIPASVSNSNKSWLLLVDLADVTASEPASGNTDWLAVGSLDSVVQDTSPQLGGNLDGQDNNVSKINLKDYGEVLNAIGSTGGGTQDIDLTLGNVVSATVDTSANTFTFSNFPASGTAGGFVLILTNGGSQTVAWPSSVDWPAATAPTLTAAGIDIIVFQSNDAGTTVYANIAGQAYA